MGNKIPSTLQSYYSTAKFRPSIHISIILSMGALLDVCIAIFKACLALSSYILEFMLNIWIGNEILSVIQLYNSMRIFFFMNWVIIQSFRSRKFVERHFWINKPFFMYIKCVQKKVDWAKYHNRHSSKRIWVNKLSFCQNDSPMGESFWQNNSLVTHILFERCL